MEPHHDAEARLIELSEQTRAGWCVTSIRGRVDSETADELERTLRDAIARHDRVAADFANVVHALTSIREIRAGIIFAFAVR